MVDCTIIDKLNYILETKDLIKTALETQDVEVLESDTFRKYSEYITEIRKVASVNGETGDIILKTINGQNLVGEGDIVIQGGGGGSVTAGVNKIIMGEEDYGWNTYTGDVKLTNGWIDLDDDGVQETYDIRIGDNSGSSLWFGFNSTDNSIKIEDNGSRLSLTVNPDILGGNVDLSDYYTKEETYSKDEVNDLLENSGGGVVTETDPIFTSWKNDDSIVAGKNAVNGATNFGILMEKNNVVVIGNNAKVQVDNGVAIGNGATVLNGAIGGVAIGANASVDAGYTTNINNVLKGDASKNAYIRDSNGNYTKIIDLINNAGGNVDLSDYYTKGEVYNKNEVNELIDEVNTGDVDLTNYYTKQEVDDKIPSLDGYATEQWVENKNYLTEHQDLTDYAKKSDIPTIPTSNTAFTNDAGFITLNEVPETDLSNYYTKEETYSKDEVDDLLENSGGGTAGVEAINIGRDVQDWTQKTGVVSFYSDWYDGSYDVAIGGMSFFGVKPIDNSIILENAGGTVNGNTRCGIKINTDNFKTINGESIFGSGNITIEGGGSSGDGKGLVDIFANNGKLIGMEENGNWRNEVSFKTINGQTIIGEEGDITIEGGSGSVKVVELTQAEYDALSEKQTDTIYVITDAVELKFKTINGQEITGEGDIEIQVNTEQFYTKSEIDALIGGVSDKITELNELI